MRQLLGYSREVDRRLPEDVPQDFDVSFLIDLRFPLSRWEKDLSPDSLDLTALEALVEKKTGLEVNGKARDDKWKNKLDGWVAPRLHAALRIPRRIAASREFWSWISLEIGRPLVAARFEKDGLVPKWRYTGILLRNAMSRLWWGAELIRNGPDYGLVANAFARTRTAQFALELAYSQYKPAAIAFVRVVEGLDGGPALSDEDMKRLSRIANALLSTRVLEACDQSMPAPSVDEQWLAATVDTAEVVSDELPIGPDEGVVPEHALARLTKWFRDLASTEEIGSVSFQCFGPSEEVVDTHQVNGPKQTTWTPIETDDGGDLSVGSREEPPLVDDNARYREFPLPESWRPVLVDFAPATGHELNSTEVDDSRIFKAFLDADLGSRLNSILLWRFLGGRTLEQIGSRLGVTRERIRQLQAKSLEEIQLRINAETAGDNDLIRILERLDHDGVVIVRGDSRAKFTAALAVECLPAEELSIQESAGYVFVVKSGFNQVMAELEDEVASRRELVSPQRLAQALGVEASKLEAATYMSDKLYVDKRGRVGTHAWTKVEMMEIVAWILALSDLEVVSWHASELVEGLKIVFPGKFTDWRARQAFAALSRPGVTSFVHAGRSGHWALSEAINGPKSTLLAVAELLEASSSPMHVDQILQILIDQGRDVRRESLTALLSTNPRFRPRGNGLFVAA